MYEAELKAVKKLLPEFKNALEIGVGSGRFASPCGIAQGIEPSPAMAEKARKKGLRILEGVAEKLELKSKTFDLALMVTTICFVDRALDSLKEAYRVLEPGGFLLLGFVDANSELGKLYESKKDTSIFYGDAVFYSTDRLVTLCRQAGFGNFAFCQTLLGDNPEKPDLHVKDGYGQGGFVVLRAQRPR